RLQRQFGPEYDRAVGGADDKRVAEAELQAREERRRRLDIRPLSQAARVRYTETWRVTQAQFVDDPRGAVATADSLIQSAMADRGRADCGRARGERRVRRRRQGTGAQMSAQRQLDENPLLPAEQSEDFTSRWREIQTSFVDEPRESVEKADELVGDMMQRLAAIFSSERERLEAQWDNGVSTEDLRVALTRYREFFARLLSA